jgi:PmbA protein
MLLAEGGVLIQDVSGVHSGANPISGEFSVGATGLRIREGAGEEGLREMTIASTIPDMLRGITAVGDDLRFFSSVGVPSILIGEMTVAGV